MSKEIKKLKRNLSSSHHEDKADEIGVQDKIDEIIDAVNKLQERTEKLIIFATKHSNPTN